MEILSYNFMGETAPALPINTQGTSEPVDTVKLLNPATGKFEDAPSYVINITSTTSEERQAMVAGDGAAIPLVYGKQRLGAKIVFLKEDSGFIYVSAVWCLGEINSIIEILTDGETIDASWVDTNYTGTTTQTANSTLAGLEATYSDTMVIDKQGTDIGVAYSVLKIPAGQFPSRIEAIVEGKKVWNGSATAYSTNPSYQLADYITSSLYGQGKTVNAASLTTAAAANDDTTGLSGNKRRESSFVITRPGKTESYVEAMRTYAGCFVVPDGDEVKLVPNRTASSSRTLDNSDIIDGSLKITKTSLMTIPTVVKVIYTDMTAEPWKDGEAVAKLTGVDAGTVEWRESVVQMQGITSYQQAEREAVERLNKLTQADLLVEFDTFDEALEQQIGDVITVTHHYGLTSQTLRILAVDPIAPGRWKVKTKEYNASVYSDSVESIDDSPDTSIASPGSPVAPTIDSITEVVQENSDGSFVSRLQINWTAPDYPWIDHYYVFWSGPSKTNKGFVDVSETEYLTPPLPELGSYTVKVSTVSTTNQTATATDTATPDGEPDVPEDPTGLVVDNNGTTVGVYVGTFTNNSTWKMKVKKGNSSSSWSSGSTEIATVAGNKFVDTDVTNGAYKYHVKLVRSDGEESANSVSSGTINVDTNFTFIKGELEGGTAYGGTFDGSVDGTATIDGTAASTVASNAASGEGRNKTFYQTSTPTAENTGDLWYSSATELFKRWNGSTWQEVATVGATFGTNIDGSMSAADVTTFIDANTFTSVTVPTLFQTAAIDEAYIGDLTASKVTTGTLGASVVYAGDIEANQIQAGSLAAGVVYTGTLNANQVTTGTLGAVDISSTTGTFGGTVSGTVTATTKMAVTIGSDTDSSATFVNSLKGCALEVEANGAKFDPVAKITNTWGITGTALDVYGETELEGDVEIVGAVDINGDLTLDTGHDLLGSSTSDIGTSGTPFSMIYTDDINAKTLNIDNGSGNTAINITGDIAFDAGTGSGTIKLYDGWIIPGGDGWGRIGSNYTDYGHGSSSSQDRSWATANIQHVISTQGFRTTHKDSSTPIGTGDIPGHATETCYVRLYNKTTSAYTDYRYVFYTE